MKNGDIVQDNNSGEVFVILTPSCDFVERFDGGGRSLGRKAENVLLAQATLLCDRDELKNYLETRSKK